jgi:hypothetical protein
LLLLTKIMIKPRLVTGNGKFASIGLAGAALLLTLAAAQRPASLGAVEGGLWEVDPLGPGARPKICAADPMVFASYEHRGKTCTRVVISDGPNGAVIHYTCTGGGFGRSTVKALTPRSLRVETQGIADNAPFQYVFQARRVGACG